MENKKKLRCMSCNREQVDTPPGLYYIDTFFKSECSRCGGDGWVCSNCTGGKTPKRCDSCERDIKIERILK